MLTKSCFNLTIFLNKWRITGIALVGVHHFTDRKIREWCYNKAIATFAVLDGDAPYGIIIFFGVVAPFESNQYLY